MTAPELDAERLAALIDGRLPPDERERLLAAIDASPALRETYADSLAALAVPASPVRRIDRRRLWPSLTPLQWLELVAAAAVVIAVAPTLVRTYGPARVPEALPLIAGIPLNDSLSAALLDQPVWGTLRGDAEGPMSADAKAVRVGAAIASFELRHRRADSAAASAALEVALLLDVVPGGAIAANAYRAIGRSGADTAIRSAARLAQQVAGARAVNVGAWLQGARFAVAARDSSYFGTGAVRAVSRAAVAMDERPDTERAIRQFEDIARARPRDWTALNTAVEELLRSLGARQMP